ncbi:unnamed protein product, partial [Darwinula stevensoni]
KKYSEQEKDKASTQNHIPSAPESSPVTSQIPIGNDEARSNGEPGDLDAFISNNRMQIEIFVNRTRANECQGRHIGNDSIGQTLFLDITSLHSRLVRAMEEEERKRNHYEGLQDRLSQIRDERAALDALREDHRGRKLREAEEAQRLRQIQMAQKLEIMRKKKQEYLEYQRLMAMQRMQEQEREMQMRHEQQKQAYETGQAQMPVPYETGQSQMPVPYETGQSQMPVPYPLSHVPSAYPVPPAGFVGGMAVSRPTGVLRKTLGYETVGPRQPSGLGPAQQPGMVGPVLRQPALQQLGAPSQGVQGSPQPQPLGFLPPGVPVPPGHASPYQISR